MLLQPEVHASTHWAVSSGFVQLEVNPICFARLSMDEKFLMIWAVHSK